jgi:hypothetical protein
MVKLGYPTKIVDFYKALLSNCYTHLKFDDFLSSIIQVDNGIGQGEPGSMILYLIYSIGLVSILEGPDEDGGAYVDNNFILALGDNYEECNRRINVMMDKQEWWTQTHNSKAEISKYQCLRLSNKYHQPLPDFTGITQGRPSDVWTQHVF